MTVKSPEILLLGPPTRHISLSQHSLLPFISHSFSSHSLLPLYLIHFHLTLSHQPTSTPYLTLTPTSSPPQSLPFHSFPTHLYFSPTSVPPTLQCLIFYPLSLTTSVVGEFCYNIRCVVSCIIPFPVFLKSVRKPTSKPLSQST